LTVLLSLLPVMGKMLLQVMLHPIFLVLVFIVGWQYKRMQLLSEGLFHLEKNIYLRSTILSTLIGVVGGVLGSFILLLFGIDLSEMGIIYLFMVAILLMLINPRFLCFAYAGGLLSLSYIFFGVPQINVPQLMGLVAILHMVESVLILVSGHLDPIPVYVKRNNGQVVGGFNLQKFWPIPLVAVISTGNLDFVGMGVALPDWWWPDWWPLIKAYPDAPRELSYVLLPVLAILGYGEIGTTASPREKTRHSAVNLFWFSLVLLGLSVIASHYSVFSILPALFSPLGHELVIMLGLRTESDGEPLYITPSRGVMILDVLPGSQAARAGLRSEDVVISVNGVEVGTRRELELMMQFGWGRLELEIRRGEQTLYFQIDRKPQAALGLVLVPDSDTNRYLSFRGETLLSRLFKLFKKFGSKSN
jgi:hypothetical protein